MFNMNIPVSTANLFWHLLLSPDMLFLKTSKSSKPLIAHYLYLFILFNFLNLTLTWSFDSSTNLPEFEPKTSFPSSFSDQLELTFEIEENVPTGTLIGIIQSPKSSQNEAHPPFLIVSLPGVSSNIFQSISNSSHFNNFNSNHRYSLDQKDKLNGVDTDFNIDQSTGEIRSAVILDREITAFYFFIAIPITGPNIKVTIIVLDTNDNAPQFPSSSIDLEFPENSKVRDVKRTLPPAIDLDLGSFGTQTYRIVSGNNGNAFRLVSHREKDDVLYHDLQVNQVLDRETVSSFLLLIEALDGGVPPLKGELWVNITILDVNDNEPIFSHSKYFGTVLENATLGTPILQVTATDLDEGPNGQVIYLLPSKASQSESSSFFGINKNTGWIYLLKPLDFESKEIHELVVAAQDSGLQPLQTSAFVSISVIDVNDNQPSISLLFLTESTRPEIPENAKVGDLVARVSINDADSKDNILSDSSISNPGFQVSLSGDEGHFKLKTTDSVIYFIIVTSPLDRESKSKYTLTVTATDHGNPPLNTSTVFDLKILDINDNPPYFESNIYYAKLPEIADPGTVVFHMKAFDPDTDSQITYSLDTRRSGSTSSSWFSIDSNSGLITTKSSVDCETESSPKLIIIASDGSPISATATLIVTISDTNDNEPIFDHSFYNATVREDEKLGACILRVSASDPDCGINALVNYTLMLVEPPKGQPSIFSGGHDQDFKINPITGELCIAKPLDFESKSSYDIPVLATDKGGLSTTAMVKVQVLDVNDNYPIFYPKDYKVSVEENIIPLTKGKYVQPAPIVIIAAMDKDSSNSDFGSIRYEIKDGNDDAAFEIDPVEGKVFIVRPLNSAKPFHQLTVIATDGGGKVSPNPALIHVSVLPRGMPLQSTSPTFSQRYYNFEIEENSAIGTQVGVVEAASSNSNSTHLTYAIYSGDSDSYFAIDPNKGIIRINSLNIDHEKHSSILLNIQAKEGLPPGPYTYAHIQANITILDVNDNYPTFATDKLQISVLENTPTFNIIVLVVHAIDLDSGLFGKITYNIVEKNEAKVSPFAINESTGAVTLKSPLDYEVQNHYQLVITATDGGGLSAQLMLDVDVQDVNDNEPRFLNFLPNFESSEPTFSVEISESLPINSHIFQVRAIDDDTGNNARLTYSLINDSSAEETFAIFPNNGMIFLKKPLDRETKDTYNLIIKVNDHGSSISLSAFAKMSIKVLDANDNKPVFTSKDWTFSISEDASLGSLIGQISATDADLGNNSTLRFNISYGFSHESTLFQLNSVTGEIYLKSSLDREVKDRYIFKVEVQDQGTPFHLFGKEKSTIIVDVLDVNDNTPTFINDENESQLQKSILLGSPENTFITTVKAFDPDNGSNGTVYYSIVNNDHFELFRIGKTSGIIKTNYKIDSINSYRIPIQATDGGGNKSQIKFIKIDVIQKKTKLPGIGTNPDSLKTFEFEVNEFFEIGKKIGSIQVNFQKANIFETYSQCLNGYYTMFESGKDNDSLKSYPFMIESNDKQTLDLILTSKLDYETQAEYNFFIFIDFWQCILILSSNDFKTRERFKNHHLVANVKINVEDNFEDCRPFAVIYNDLKEKNISILEIKVPINEETIHQKAIDIYSLQGISSHDCFNFNLIFKIESMMLDQEIVNQLFTISNQGLIQLRPFDKKIVQDLLNYRELLIVIKAFVDNNDGSHLIPIESLIVKIKLVKDEENIDQVGFVNPNHFNFDEDCCSKFENIFQVRLNLSTFDFDVRFNLEEKNSKSNSIFSIERETGLISLLDTFDFESVSEYKLNVTAVIYPKASVSTSISRNSKLGLSPLSLLTVQNPIKFISKLFTIQINDVNDEKPNFLSNSYSTEVLETVKPGTIIITIQAKDLDSNSMLTYIIPDGHESESYFEINSKSGEIKTIAKLNRELKAVHQIPIFVFDNDFKHFQKTHLTVKLIDVNDNAPVFSNPNQSIRIPENILLGTVFFTLIAFDEDLTSSAGLNYKIIAGNEDQKFEIDEKIGSLKTLATLDRETKEQYNLTIQVSDSVFTSFCNLTIDLLDLNDNSPFFEKNIYHVVIDVNNFSSGDVIKEVTIVKAIDPDQNDKVYYSINTTSSPEAIYFTIDSFTGLITTSSTALAQAQKIKMFEQNSNYSLKYFNFFPSVSFAFEVLAMDIGLSPYAAHIAKAIVQVTISNKFDFESPRLISYPYLIEAQGYKEDYKVGQEIGRILIHRRYFENNDSSTSFNFRVIDENSNLRFTNYFDVDLKSGSILVKKSLVADYYECLIEVEKIGSPFSTLNLLQIVLTGKGLIEKTKSKKVKVFNYKVDIYENIHKGTEVINLITKSRLTLVKNGDHKFEFAYSSINQSYFQLNPNTGLLTVEKILDYEMDPSLIEMIIIAKSSQHPFENLLFFNVSISLLNLIDNTPKFTQNHYIATVKESEPKGTFVFQISALDLDNIFLPHLFQNFSNKRRSRSGQNTLTYHILEGNHDNAFEIVPSSSGIVRTNIVLDREIRDHYVLKIVANDASLSDSRIFGNNFHLSSQCTLEISVIDINDNVPVFPPYQEINISEDIKIGSIVTTLTANDVDTFPPLTYYKQKSSLIIDETDDLFDISLYTGKIILKSKIDDFSQISYPFKPKEYKINILASDSLHTIETQVIVKIKEASIYKKTPLFINDSILIQVNSRTHPCIYLGSINCEISQLEAISISSKPKIKVNYRLGLQSDKSFYIDNFRGIIYNNRSLREIQSQLYQLTIFAEYVYENGRAFGGLKSRCSVIINVRGVNQSLNETDLIKEEKTFYSIKIAKDSFGQTLLNLGENGSKVKLSIINGNFGNVFAIKKNMELIKVRGSTQNEYRLEIEKKRELEEYRFETVMIIVKIKIIGEDKESRSAAFNSRVLDIDVREDVLVGYLVTNFRKKEDNDYENYFYQISSGNEANHFKINQTSGTLIVSQSLNFDSRNYYHISVTAFREPLKTFEAICILNINVLNVNDHLPKFPLAHYKAVVEENAPIGSKVLKLDPINLHSSKINYTLVRTLNDDLAPFIFDKKSGHLLTSGIIDYESMNIYSPPIYKLILKAFQSESSFTKILIEVKVASQDEFVPKFQTESYHFKVTTSFGVSRVKVGQVSAMDLDAGPDGHVIYTLRSSSPASALSKFNLNSSTGIVTLNTALIDQIPPQHTSLIISASSGRAESLSSLTVVEVTLTLFEDTSSINNVFNSSPLPKRENNLFIKSTSTTTLNQKTSSLPGWIIFLIVLLIIISVVLLVSIVVIRLHHQQQQQHHHSITSSHGINHFVPGVGSLLRKIGANRSNTTTLDQNMPFDATTIHTLHHQRRHHSHHSQFLMNQGSSPPCYNDVTLVNSISSGIGITGEELSASSGRGSAENEDDVEADLDDVDEEVRMINEGNDYYSFGVDNRGINESEFIPTITEYLARLGVRDHLDEVQLASEEEDNEIQKLKNNSQTFQKLKTSRQISTNILKEESKDWISMNLMEEEFSDAYNWDYLRNWGPKYQPLSNVFVEIARLKGTFSESGLESEETANSSFQSKLEDLESISNKSGSTLSSHHSRNHQLGINSSMPSHRLSQLKTMQFLSHSAFQPFYLTNKNPNKNQHQITGPNFLNEDLKTSILVDQK